MVLDIRVDPATFPVVIYFFSRFVCCLFVNSIAHYVSPGWPETLLSSRWV